MSRGNELEKLSSNQLQEREKQLLERRDKIKEEIQRITGNPIASVPAQKNHDAIEAKRQENERLLEQLARRGTGQVVHHKINPPEVDKSRRVIQFRCALTDQHFYVVFHKFTPNHKFQIVEILQANEGENRVAVGKTGNSARQESTFDNNDFEWSGWFCPCCGHGKSKEVPLIFVRCSKCEEYVCGARVYFVAGERKMFACSAKCGGGGGNLEDLTVLDGQNLMIPSNVNRQVSARNTTDYGVSGERTVPKVFPSSREKALKEADEKLLPSSTKGLLPPKR